jgi:hypothetical protein
MSGFGSSPLHLEMAVNTSEWLNGWRQDIPIPLSDWTLGTGAVLTTGTTPRLSAVATNANMLVWAFNDDAADPIQFQFVSPRQWDTTKNDLVLRVWARKKDAASGRERQPQHPVPDVLVHPAPDQRRRRRGSSLQPDHARDGAELAASSTGADLSSFALYELDLGARLAAESKTVAVGDMVRLVLGPNEQVGTTDMNMEVLAIALRTRHHFTFNNRTLRNLP